MSKCKSEVDKKENPSLFDVTITRNPFKVKIISSFTIQAYSTYSSIGTNV